MKTTLKELLVKATPLPLHLNPDNPTWIDGAANEPVATTAHGDLHYEVQKSNAALLAHACNMLPEVLAMMGRLQSIVESEFPVSDERYQAAIKADELFIKANIVTIP